MSKLAENIKEYRKKHSLSQSNFASKLYVTKQAVSKWETGRGYPDSSLIPEIAKVMDITIDELMGVKRVNKKTTIIISMLILIIILSIVFIPVISNRMNEIKEFDDFKNRIETNANMDLPDKGYAVNANLDEWIFYGNSVWAESMSYMVFNEYNETDDFEVELETSDKWVSSLDSNLIDVVPVYLQSYTTSGDYYCLFNKSSGTYNTVPIAPGGYEYVFLIYQLDNNRLIVFDFSYNVQLD